MAVYLQLISPRKCEPGYVIALFLAGTAMIMLMMLFITDLTRIEEILVKIGAVFLSWTSGGVATFFIWENGSIPSVRESYRSMFEDDSNRPHAD